MIPFLVIALLVIAFLIYRSRKNTSNSISSSVLTNQSGSKSNSERQRAFSGNYQPQSIQRIGLQTLETIFIIGNSKAIDTIAGRYTFLLSIVDVLMKGQNNSRYVSDIQKSIDKYKSMYYDRVPQRHELAFLINPNESDLAEFYGISLLNAFKKYYTDYLTEINALKREDAKVRRKEKAGEVLIFTVKELNAHCTSAKSYSVILAELKTFETEFISESLTDIGQPESQRVIPISISIQKSTSDSIKANQPFASSESEFILNPGASFELTLLNADAKLGMKIRNILADENIYSDKKNHQIVALFAEFNLKVKEVETYKKKYGKIYFAKLEELKNNSMEWKNSGEKDKSDLMDGFRQIALKEIYEQTNSDSITLFEKEPKDITIDDELIKEYGFDSMETYFRFAYTLEKVRVLPSDNYNRPRFEKLVEIGLAIRGNAIPMEEILTTLSLKDLNEIAKNSEKEYKRKNQAVEYIVSQPNIEERIGSKITFRELFKLKPLPPKYASINVQEIIDTWAYTNEVVTLLVETHANANYTAQTLKDKEFVKEYKVENFDGAGMCPCAKELIKKTYPKSRPPKIPYHIGCNCSIGQEYKFD